MRTRFLIASLGLLGALGFLVASSAAGDTPPAAQPVAFSHRLHAGDNAIGCTMCHSYAESGPIAGIPSAARCEGCHKFIGADKPEVQKVRKAYEDGTPVQWVRVHRVPDHVYFTHERHVKAGVECSTCHGDVAKMDVVNQVSSLQMGWCVDCHRLKNASLDCGTCHK